ncbi:MAG: hypothetical protein AAF670_18030 [Planctomycetota bacterium]
MAEPQDREFEIVEFDLAKSEGFRPVSDPETVVVPEETIQRINSEVAAFGEERQRKQAADYQRLKNRLVGAELL